MCDWIVEQEGRSVGEGSVMGARLPGVGENDWFAGGSGAL